MKKDPAATALVLTDPIEYANYMAGKSVDWHDVLLRKGNTKDISLTLSGGTDKFHYYMNGDIYLENGIVQHRWNGVEAFAYVGKHLSLYANIRDNRMDENFADTRYLTDFPGRDFKTGGDYSDMRGEYWEVCRSAGHY